MDRTRTISSTAHLARLMSDTSPATRRHGTTRSHLRTLLAPVTTPEPLLPTCEVSKRHDTTAVQSIDIGAPSLSLAPVSSVRVGMGSVTLPPRLGTPASWTTTNSWSTGHSDNNRITPKPSYQMGAKCHN